MKVFIARQAIFNRKQQVVAYELLFRDGEKNSFPNVSDETATSRLIMDNQLNLGLKSITGGRKALVNFGAGSLQAGLSEFLPPDQVVIEILESVEPTDENYELVRRLFHEGFRMALDDFAYKPEWRRFLKLVRMVKFDIIATPLDEIGPIVTALSRYPNLKLLAEKIETQEDYKQARDMGFHFFQGYYFAQPQMLQFKDAVANYPLVMAVYAETVKKNIDITRITRYFEQDTALAYKLLRLINSGLFPLKERIESMKQALVYLGENRVRKFVNLIMTAYVARDKPPELMQLSIIRSRFCELVAKKVCPAMSNQAFLVGLFSLIDAILDQPMEQVVERLPFPEPLHEALLGSKNTLYYILEVVKAYEKGSWWAMQKACEPLNMSDDCLPEFYQSAIAWAEMHKEI